MKNKAVYPGTFDPLTNGHVDIMNRAAAMFGGVTVAVAKGDLKKPVFTWEERIDMVKKAAAKIKGVKVTAYDGLLVDFLKKTGKKIVIRGLRVATDFEYEFQLALMNKKLYKNVEMIYMLPDEKYLYVSSTRVKELAYHGGKASAFVPPHVAIKLRQKFRQS